METNGQTVVDCASVDSHVLLHMPNPDLLECIVFTVAQEEDPGTRPRLVVPS